MADPYLGEIRIFAGANPPAQWLLCHGQSLPIADYQTLFSLIGTTYGGDGVSNFLLPDLRGRLPTGNGQGPGLSNYAIGQAYGVESVALQTAQLATHNHTFYASAAAATSTTPAPTGTMTLANVGAPNYFYENGPQAGGTTTLLNAAALSTSGGNPAAAHENRMPIMALNYIIATVGIYPVA
jgi:microcystin-dependent protein